MAKTQPAKKKSVYSVHPSFAMEAAYVENIKKRTGRSIDDWVRFVKRHGPPTEKERREWLKVAHGLTTNYAWWVAELSVGKRGVEDYDPDAYVEAMFCGSKAGLQPLYEKLLKLALSLGKDVKACPCQTIVPLYRTHVFAQLKPTTRTRLDLSLALKDTKVPPRLIDTGGFAKKDRLTHRIPIEKASDIDDEVKRWLKYAYDLNP